MLWQVWRERAVYVLLFLLPVGGVSVRHWISTTFALLFLLSLPEILRRPRDLLPAERHLFAIVAAFFAIFVVTALANGWTEVQTRYAGREVRFLLLIPIYLMVRRYPDAGLWLIRGSIPAGFVYCAQALYDTYYLDLLRAQGVYSPNLLGPLAALSAVFLLVHWRIDRDRPWLRAAIALSIAAALVAVALSVSRGAFVGLLGMLFVWGAFRFRGRYYVAALAGIVLFALLSYNVSDHVRRGIDAAVTEMVRVVEAGDVTDMKGPLGSVPARLEMWHVSLLIFRDNPVLGVGRGNYLDAVQEYVERGAVHCDVARYSHPHDAYLEVLVSKGILGLATLLALLLYPLGFFLRTRQASAHTALLGALLISGIALFSLTDASTYIKGNYIAYFVTYLSVLVAWHMHRLRARER